MDAITRRHAFKVTAALGMAAAVHPVSSEAGKGDPEEMNEEKKQSTAVESFQAIDTHIHVTDAQLPGVPDMTLMPDGTSFQDSLDTVAEGIRREMNSAGIVKALAMPCWNRSDDDPLGIRRTEQLASLIPGLFPIGLADPTRTDARHLGQVEEQLQQGTVKALKAYLGYLHYSPSDPGYLPYYRLAARYNLPVIFHTGDTYSHLAKLKYSQPLPIDDIAVDYPDVRFVIAHLGCPWFSDVAELVYKNNKRGVKENVWTDLSGIVVGTAEAYEEYRKQGALQIVMNRIREAFYYTERPDRFLYGTDWPLSPMATYRDFIREAIPAEYHQAVFHDNAKQLFGL